MKKILLGTFLIIVIIIIVKSSDTKSVKAANNITADSTSVINVDNNSATEIIKPIAKWDYSEQKDPMTDKTMYFAIAQSANELDFDFPYDGGSSLYIQVRKKEGANEVMLNISKGQFMSSYDNIISIKFDSGSIFKYGFDEPSDGSSNLIFLHSPKSIIDKLKKAKHVKIEAPFYQAGRKVAEFDVSGLNWNH